ncbi:MAG: hypothetical protein WC516_07025 [Patescibacteria group bacterium]|jgi:hypothetical protein
MKSLNFPISKRAIIQLPPETTQMWQWVKTKYAQRVLANFKYQFLSEKESKEIIQECAKSLDKIYLLKNELKSAKTLGDEITLVKKYGLIVFKSYEIGEGTYLDTQIILRTNEKNHEIPSEKPVWRCNNNPFTNLQGVLEETITKLIENISLADSNYMDDKELVEQTMFKQKVLKDAKAKIPFNYLSAGTEIPINTQKWEMYGISNVPQEIELKIQQTADNSAYGEWLQENLAILIYVLPDDVNPDSLYEYSIIQLRLKQTVNHEVRHMIQTLINKSKNIETGGLPKYKTPGYDPYGYKEEFKYLEKKPSQNYTGLDKLNLTERELTRQPHALRAIEYHTRLADSVEEFNQLKTKFPKSELANLTRTFIGEYPMFKYNGQIIITDEFFQTLKNDVKTKLNLYEKSKSKEAEQNLSKARKRYYQAAKQFLKEIL